MPQGIHRLRPRASPTSKGLSRRLGASSPGQVLRRPSLLCRPFVSQERSDSKVSSFQPNLCNETPDTYWGRLRHFLVNWQKITTDQWVLSTIREGYKLEFLEIPQFTGIRPTSVPVKEQKHILEEINTLLQKDAIEKVHVQNAQQGFYSTFS